MKNIKNWLICLILLLMVGCATKEDIELDVDESSTCENQCEEIVIKSADYKGIVVGGKDRTKESLLELEEDVTIDSRLFGIWMDESEDSVSFGKVYIFFKDGTFFESFRFAFGQGQLYSGTYRTEGNILYLTHAGSKEEKYFYEFNNETEILRVKHEAWITHEYIMKKLVEK